MSGFHNAASQPDGLLGIIPISMNVPRRYRGPLKSPAGVTKGHIYRGAIEDGGQPVEHVGTVQLPPTPRVLVSQFLVPKSTSCPWRKLCIGMSLTTCRVAGLSISLLVCPVAGITAFSSDLLLVRSPLDFDTGSVQGLHDRLLPGPRCSLSTNLLSHGFETFLLPWWKTEVKLGGNV